MEREAFLSRVRDSAKAAHLPPHPPSDPGPLVPDLPDTDLAGLFTARLEEVEGQVHRAGSDAEAVGIVDEIARGHDVASFMAWDDEHLPGGLSARLEQSFFRVSGHVPNVGRLAHQQGYASVGLGVTGAEAGFAETGSFVVRSGPGRPRMASVVPLVHIALLAVSQIHRSPSHWGAVAAGTIAAAANVVYVTGPSRTADIEQNINVGVHGPRYVHVILTDG